MRGDLGGSKIATRIRPGPIDRKGTYADYVVLNNSFPTSRDVSVAFEVKRDGRARGTFSSLEISQLLRNLFNNV